MLTYLHDDPIVLSSSCPHSSSLVTCAVRMGGKIDPDFLLQCQITDKILEEKIAQLKPIAINYDCLPANFGSPDELFLDMGVPEQRRFFNHMDFQRYNSWLTNPSRWNTIYTFNDDLII